MTVRQSVTVLTLSFCGLSTFTAKAFERTHNHRPFLFVQVETIVRHKLTRLLSEFPRQIAPSDRVSARDDDGTLNRMLELSDVARPRLPHHGG